MTSHARFALVIFTTAFLGACGGGGGGGGGDSSPVPGPSITCSQPTDGAILTQSPGTVTFTGSVRAPNGLSAFSVNGASVAVASGGTFSAPITAAWGTNFVDLTATDAAGLQARSACAFLLSESFVQDAALLSDAISVRAAQLAFDDGAVGLNSVAGFLRTIVNSSGFRATLNDGVLAANPIKPNSCDQTVLGVCVLRSAITYLGLGAAVPTATTSLQLVSGGVMSASSVSSVQFRLNVSGSVGPIPFNTDGLVTFSSLGSTLIFDTLLSGGRPRVQVRSGSVAVNVGQIATDFSGLDGTVINIVADLANGTFRNLAASTFSSFITSNFNSTLDLILGNLDVRNLPATFQVARFDGGTALPVDFGIGFSSLSTSSIRTLIGVSTKFSAAAAHTRPSAGAPVPPGTRLLDPALTTAMQSALHMGLFNQVLHALWRGGYFDATLPAGALGGLVPPGAALALTANLPPAANLRNDGRIEMALGAVAMHLDDPALVGAPLDGTLGGRVSCAVSLNGTVLSFGSCTVDELHVSPGRVLGAATQTALEDFLGPIVNAMLSSAANTLPALPLPSFRTPPSLAGFGLPANANLGIKNPSLTPPSGGHLVVSGAFGVQ